MTTRGITAEEGLEVIPKGPLDAFALDFVLTTPAARGINMSLAQWCRGRYRVKQLFSATSPNMASGKSRSRLGWDPAGRSAAIDNDRRPRRGDGSLTIE